MDCSTITRKLEPICAHGSKKRNYLINLALNIPLSSITVVIITTTTMMIFLMKCVAFISHYFASQIFSVCSVTQLLL